MLVPMTSPSRTALVVAFLVAGMASDARAQQGVEATSDRPAAEVPTVAVMAFQGSVRRALASVPAPDGIQVIAGENLVRRRDEVLRVTGPSDQVPALREQARALHLAFEFDAACSALAWARQALILRHSDLIEDDSYAWVEVDLARVMMDQGEPAPAREALFRAALACPDIQPEPDDYPPNLLQAWSEVVPASRVWDDINFDVDRLAGAGRDVDVDFVLTGRTRGGTDTGSRIVDIVLIRARDDAVVGQGVATVGVPATWPTALEPEVTRLLATIRPPPTPADRPDAPVTAYLVLSSPSGASVSIDGEPANQTTPAFLGVDPGAHRLSVTLAGHRTFEIEAVAWEGQTRPIEVELQRGSDRRWYRSWWFWSVVGVVVTGAVAGFVTWGVIANRDDPDVTVVVSP
jgi:hypothetical protein